MWCVYHISSFSPHFLPISLQNEEERKKFETADFDQPKSCKAPICWSKYTEIDRKMDKNRQTECENRESMTEKHIKTKAHRKRASIDLNKNWQAKSQSEK